MSNNLVIKFEGSMAEQHIVPAYNAAQAIAGITRSIMIPAAYLEHGKIKHRNLTKTRAFQLNLLAQREGSFETLIDFIIKNEFLLGVGVGVTIDLVKDFIYSLIRRCIGEKADANSTIEELEAADKLKSGDLTALVEVLEPPIKMAHNIINNGANNVFIIHGDRNVVTLNSETKRFVNTSIEGEILLVKEFSVGSFNANTGNGRVFDYSEGRTVPFKLDSAADGATINVLMDSLKYYARKKRLDDESRSRVALQYKSITAPDERIKKIVVFKARTGMDDLIK